MKVNVHGKLIVYCFDSQRLMSLSTMYLGFAFLLHFYPGVHFERCKTRKD